ncbi:IclR family transcriptional regulator C-terminal domain-containing protein [Burkholderia sp. Ac-20353]|uniref:IclR family transcriptional regulator domain-containing protein n=1 Tax=Burkholderia sp. Ac-20353 TaxID=2703894 RepID=UPI00197B5F6D|nr:IclR family transcriptional regulator C-terminal domain-containing protein [Burkholderia sp. Ac-20353]MBN3787664.1 helix-turn-helix domain-containing protein [Burkholderia sp. Ac-20353]
MSEDAQDRDYIQSIERCMTVISTFKDSKRAQMSLSEIAAITGLSKPTVRRILLTLQRLGYAQAQGTRFGLTPKMLELGYAYLSSLNLTEIATPMMESLTDFLSESTALVALDGADVVYINRVHRHRISSITLAVGTRLPAHATSSGHVLLADLSEQALSEYFRIAELKSMTEHTLTTRAALTQRLEMVRSRGWDAVDQELEIGRRSAAAPIKDVNGKVVAALSVSCGTGELRFQQLIDDVLPHVLATARTISDALGAGRYQPT